MKSIVDERIRLLTAVLAASDWPEQEQAQLTHAVHPHAKRTRQFVADWRGHTAVTHTNQMLQAGVPLAALFSAIWRSNWPDMVSAQPLPQGVDVAWATAVADFGRASSIVADFWPQHEALWQESVAELQAVFADAPLLLLLAQVRQQPIAETVALMPMLVYPMLTPVVATAVGRTLLVLPPPKAVGESPPWPYREDPPWVVAQAGAALASHYLSDVLATLSAEQAQTLVQALIAQTLRQRFDPFEARAYIVRRKKELDLPQLPDIATRLAGWLDAPTASIVDLF